MLMCASEEYCGIFGVKLLSFVAGGAQVSNAEADKTTAKMPMANYTKTILTRHSEMAP